MLALCYHATTESSSSGRAMLTVPNVQDGRGGEAASRCALTGWQERHGMLRSFRREMRAHPRLSMGFGLFWTWVWLVFQTTFFNPPLLAALDFPLPGWVVPLSAYACTFLVLGVLLKARRIVPQGRWYRIAVPASMSIGVTTCRHPFLLAFDRGAGERRGGVPGRSSHGRGHGVPSCGMGSHLGRSGPRTTILHGVVGTVVAALLTVCITLLPEAAVWAAALVIPAASMALLMRDAPVTPDLLAHGLDAPLHVPRKFLATAFVQGLSFGIVQAVLLMGGHDEPVVALSQPASRCLPSCCLRVRCSSAWTSTS